MSAVSGAVRLTGSDARSDRKEGIKRTFICPSGYQDVVFVCKDSSSGSDYWQSSTTSCTSSSNRKTSHLKYTENSMKSLFNARNAMFDLITGVRCTDPDIGQEQNVVIDEGNSLWGDRRTYTCSAGYKFTGQEEQTIQCRSDKSWTQTSCESKLTILSGQRNTYVCCRD